MESTQPQTYLANMKQIIQSIPLILIPVPFLIYLLTVRYLRFNNVRKLERRYAKYLNDPYSMDYKTAFEIMKVTMLRDVPFMFLFGTQWALIKSYGIASGTKLLVQTGRLTNKAIVGKRSEDTGALLGEILFESIDSERGLLAMSKINWIHARYGSKITNDELIHTLALFVLEPHRWVDTFDWRPLTKLERVAHFIYWKEIGNRMGMQGIPPTLEDLQTWTVEYEKTAMRYADSNRKCYDATVSLFLKGVPSFLLPFMEKVSSCFLEDYVRDTMGVPHPPKWLQSTVDGFFLFRGWLLRHFFLPRFKEFNMGIYKASNGRWKRTKFVFEPWYVEETIWSNLQRRLGLSNPTRTPGPEYMSEGFLPEELGPIEYIEKSRTPVLEQAKHMKSYAEQGGAVGMGCPFMLART